MGDLLLILNGLALFVGWAILISVGIVLAAIAVLWSWSMLMEQVWEAGQRVQHRRRLKRIKEPGQ